MEAVALDGLEMLMEPLAKANPNAKAPICQKGNDVSGFRHFGEASNGIHTFKQRKLLVSWGFIMKRYETIHGIFMECWIHPYPEKSFGNPRVSYEHHIS